MENSYGIHRGICILNSTQSICQFSNSSYREFGSCSPRQGNNKPHSDITKLAGALQLLPKSSGFTSCGGVLGIFSRPRQACKLHAIKRPYGGPLAWGNTWTFWIYSRGCPSSC